MPEPTGSPLFISPEVPLYYQLATILREQILSGIYAPGDQLPTEAELVAEYGISRITVRQALQTLEDSRLIRREAGRGTFVTHQSTTREAILLDGSLDEPGALGQETSVELLDRRRAAANRRDAEVFGLEIGADLVRAERRRFHRGEPFSYIVLRLPEDIAALLEPEDWQGHSILRALQKRWQPGEALDLAERTIRATLADASIARHLATRIGAPVLVVDRKVRTAGGRVVARIRTYYRSEIYSLTVPS